jgi:hypothetical protein
MELAVEMAMLNEQDGGEDESFSAESVLREAVKRHRGTES